jgi:hypothetical protein
MDRIQPGFPISTPLLRNLVPFQLFDRIFPFEPSLCPKD